MKWISMKDRLPEVNERGESKHVLLFVEPPMKGWSNIWVGWLQSIKEPWVHNYWQISSNILGWSDPQPTHWMPLPEPPTE